MAVLTQRSSSARRVLGVLAVVSGTLLGGCSVSGTGREAYFASRADTVMFKAGSGETRLSVWPDSPFGNDMALAEGSDAVSRWTATGR